MAQEGVFGKNNNQNNKSKKNNAQTNKQRYNKQVSMGAGKEKQVVRQVEPRVGFKIGAS